MVMAASIAMLASLIVPCLAGSGNGNAAVHFPRTHRPAKAFNGIQETLEYQIMSEDKRTVYQKIDHVSGFFLEYNMTLRHGVYNLDLDMNVIHVDCEPGTQFTVLHVLDVAQALAALDGKQFIVGDHTWGCTSGSYNDSRPEATYREIIRVSQITENDNQISVESVPVPFTYIFESASIKMNIPPNSDDSSKVATYPDTVSYANHFSYDVNYDATTKRATQGSIEIPMGTLGTAHCEQCFFHCEVGITFELTIGYDIYYFPKVNYLYMDMYGDSRVSAYVRVTDPSVGISDEAILAEKHFYETPIVLMLGVIPLVLVPAVKLVGQVEVVESTMTATLFGGFDASASIRYGIEATSATESYRVIDTATWEFNGTPLSLSAAHDGGKLNVRLYLTPRLILSPYGIVDFFVDVKPYVGVELWDASSALTNPDPGDLDTTEFNSGHNPSAPAAPVVVSVTSGTNTYTHMIAFLLLLRFAKTN
jgi:hypothetical protein